MGLEEMIVWVDTETTGTNMFTDTILEVAATATTMGGAPIGEPVSTLVDPGAPLGEVIGTASETAQHQHEMNGLWAELWGHPTLPTAQQVDALLTRWVEDLPLAEGGVLYWGGASPLLDRALLPIIAPGFCSRFHHRTVDVTSIMLFCSRNGTPPAPPQYRAHRALEDVLCAAQDYRHYVTILKEQKTAPKNTYRRLVSKKKVGL